MNPHSNVIPVTRVNGITSVVTEPEGGIISGSSAMIQLAGWTPQEMTLKAPLAMHIHFPRLRTHAFDEVPQDEEAAKEAAKNYTKQIDKLRDVFQRRAGVREGIRARTNDATSSASTAI